MMGKCGTNQVKCNVSSAVTLHESLWAVTPSVKVCTARGRRSYSLPLCGTSSFLPLGQSLLHRHRPFPVVSIWECLRQRCSGWKRNECRVYCYLHGAGDVLSLSNHGVAGGGGREGVTPAFFWWALTSLLRATDFPWGGENLSSSSSSSFHPKSGHFTLHQQGWAPRCWRRRKHWAAWYGEGPVEEGQLVSY